MAPFPAPPFLQKICARSEALIQAVRLPRPLVFSNGVFDVLHRGHVSYLAQARELGASLMIALNTDASARRLGKGANRPVNPEQDRAVMLAALESVSLVTWFEEDSPIELIRELRPDWLVKGGDYEMNRLAETGIVEQYGGRALAIPLLEGYSTSKLLWKIRS